MKRYITTAIPYANAAPHIGTAMDYLYADILQRYFKAQDDEVLLSIGTDEHGTKIEQKAKSLNQSPQEFVDSLQVEFEKMREMLNLDRSTIRNIRTSNIDHKNRVQKIWQKLVDADMIYKDSYEGWYCVGCEAFLTENEAMENNYVCPNHKKPLEKVSEENYYLRCSKYSEEISNFIQTNIIPKFRANELMGMIKDGIQDVSISRPTEKLKWGISVPGDDSQVMYVWLDALSNYITALNYPDDNWDKDFWPADVEIIGKDILRFHAIIWPSILLGLGLDLPQKLLAHGFINVDGQKMSKSLGNVVSPQQIIEKYNTDTFRYYFSRHIPTFEDGDFSWEKLEKAYNNELANELGNLVSRLTNMIKKYNITFSGQTIDFSDIEEKYHEHMKKYETAKTIDVAWTLVQDSNRYIDETQPWQLAKEDPEKLSEVLNKLWVNMQKIAELLMPFLPETAQKIQEIFGNEEIGENIILFPRIK